MKSHTWTADRIARIAGRGGYVTYEVEASSSAGVAVQLVFDGSIFGGPVALSQRDGAGWGHRETVDEPRRYGEYASAKWVIRFLRTWTGVSTGAHSPEPPVE